MSDNKYNYIIAHPRFVKCRLAYVEAVIAVHEGNPVLREWLRDVGRIMIFDVILCLWGGYKPGKRETWPTVQRLKSEMARFDVASPRQIDKLITRLEGLDLVEMVSTNDDARVKLVLPTQHMITADYQLLKAHFVPLDALFSGEAPFYSFTWDEPFYRAFRESRIQILPHVADVVLKQNKPVMRFLVRAFGAVALMKLVRHFARGEMRDFSIAKSAEKSGVSQVQIRNILQSAHDSGDIEIDRLTGIELKPSLLSSFDRLVADGMSVTEITYQRAIALMEKERQDEFRSKPSAILGMQGNPA